MNEQDQLDLILSRCDEHNKGKIFSTKYRKPLVLVYYEAFLSEKDARKREQTLKNYGQGITNLYKRLSDSFKLAR